MASILGKASGGAHFSFEIDGIPAFDRAFNRIDEEIDDLRSVWPAVTQEIEEIEVEQFNSEGAVGASGKWAALSKAYGEYKAVKFPNQPILRATNSLFDMATDHEAPGAVYRPLRSELTIGVKHEGAIYHQRGTPKMPARKIYSFSESQKRRIQKAIQSELVRFVRRQGFTVLEKAA